MRNRVTIFPMGRCDNVPHQPHAHPATEIPNPAHGNDFLAQFFHIAPPALP